MQSLHRHTAPLSFNTSSVPSGTQHRFISSLPSQASSSGTQIIASPSGRCSSSAANADYIKPFLLAGSTGLVPAALRRSTIAHAGAAGAMGGHGGGAAKKVETLTEKILVGTAVAYIGLMVLVPFGNVFYQAFHKGIEVFAEHLLDPDFLHSVKLTLMLAAVAVPINVLFGLVAAINITRNEFPGKVFLLSLLDLPFSISPVVVGLMLTLLYGRTGWFGPLLQQAGIPVVFAFAGMALATMFVTLPFVVRELIPILETMDLSQEEAARSLGANDWQVFWNVTLPNIRWGLLYGTILTNARAMGEFGAVSVISGNILGKTQTLTLFVESAYKEYNTEAAFAAAVLLSTLALMTLFIKDKVEQAAAQETRK